MSMEIAVLSDIHGNYVALEQCVKYVLARNINTFIFLGDYLGEFPYPQKTMEKIYDLKTKKTCFFVRGNKEDYWINRRYDDDCEWKDGNQTVGAMQYCYEHQTERDIDFFQNLSIAQEIQFENRPAILACHGSPNRNNEKMLPDNDRTKQIIDECMCKYILCGHTHLQGVIKHGDKVVLNPGSVGVSLHSGGKAQFMILHQNMQEWTHEFISIDYDKVKVINEMKESGLEKAAPYWTQVTKHLILTGGISHGTVLAKAMKLCEEETGKSNWYNVPDKYWEKAIAELMERDFFLKTDRIGFSKWSQNDMELAKLLWGDPEVTRYICASGIFSMDDIENRLSTEILNESVHKVQYWPIFELATNDLIGCCGLRPYKANEYEIGFHLRPEFWGKGYAKEAADAIIDYAFSVLKARKIFAGHNPNNIASQKVLSRLGFTYVRDEFYEPTGLFHPSYELDNSYRT